MSNSLRVPDINSVILAVRLTRDPEVRTLPSGAHLTKLSLAYNRKWRGKDGESKEETLFVNGTCWDKVAKHVGENFHKGDPAIIEGRLKMNEWEDKSSGQKRERIEITVERVQPLEWPDKDAPKGAQEAEDDDNESPL